MRISRVEAFEAQGVTLNYPQRSWSGTRREDGTVVIAIREHDVQVLVGGFSCLLWTPVIESATEWVDRPSKHERLEHCRLAYMHARASGLMVYAGSGDVERDAVLALRVEKSRGEYWATWGTAARASRLPHRVSSRSEPLLESARMAA
jgi:hypothetical protein